MYRGTAVGQIVQYVQGYRCGSNSIVQSVQGVVLKTNSIEQSVQVCFLETNSIEQSVPQKKQFGLFLGGNSVCSVRTGGFAKDKQNRIVCTGGFPKNKQFSLFCSTKKVVRSVPGGVFGLFCTYREKSLLKKSSYHSSVRSVLYVQGQGYCRIHDYLSILSGATTLTYYLGRVCLCVCASSSTSKRKFNGKNLSKECCAMIKSSPLASSLSVYEEILVSFEV